MFIGIANIFKKFIRCSGRDKSGGKGNSVPAGAVRRMTDMSKEGKILKLKIRENKMSKLPIFKPRCIGKTSKLTVGDAQFLVRRKKILDPQRLCSRDP